MATRISKTIVAVAALCFIVAGVAAAWPSTVLPQDAPKWEYKALEMSPSNIDRDVKSLDELGGQGWEVVTVAQNGTLNCYFILKRRK